MSEKYENLPRNPVSKFIPAQMENRPITQTGRLKLTNQIILNIQEELNNLNNQFQSRDYTDAKQTANNINSILLPALMENLEEYPSERSSQSRAIGQAHLQNLLERRGGYLVSLKVFPYLQDLPDDQAENLANMIETALRGKNLWERMPRLVVRWFLSNPAREEFDPTILEEARKDQSLLLQ